MTYLDYGILACQLIAVFAACMAIKNLIQSRRASRRVRLARARLARACSDADFLARRLDVETDRQWRN